MKNLIKPNSTFCMKYDNEYYLKVTSMPYPRRYDGMMVVKCKTKTKYCDQSSNKEIPVETIENDYDHAPDCTLHFN